MVDLFSHEGDDAATAESDCEAEGQADHESHEEHHDTEPGHVHEEVVTTTVPSSPGRRTGSRDRPGGLHARSRLMSER